jgi:serine protease inhibitor
MDFRNADPSQTMGVINDWVSDVTDGQIAHLMDAPPSPDSKMIIVNALSMDAKWLNQFDPAETFDKGLFFLPGNKR